MNVTQTTKASWIIGSGGAPADPLGWKPEQIVPENAKAGMGGFPLSVAANNNQAIWIEIYTRKDLPAGMYDGAVTVTTDGTAKSIPLELELFNFTLPDTNSMNEMIYFESGQPSLYQGNSSLIPAYHRLAHRNRVEFVDAYADRQCDHTANLLWDVKLVGVIHHLARGQLLCRLSQAECPPCHHLPLHD
jgi:hypothetical protein